MSIYSDFKGFTETGGLQAGDAVPLQRGEQNFWVKAENLGGGIFKVSYELSTSELEDLNNTPITIVPAQGANTYIDFISGMAFRNGTAFTATDPILKLVWTGSTTERYSTSSTFLTDVAATNCSQMHPKTVGNRVFANTGLDAYLTNNVTTATGTVTIEVIFRVNTFT